MQATILLTENEIRLAISHYIKHTYHLVIKPNQLPIKVHSKQNYKADWEEAAIKIDGPVTVSSDEDL